MDPYRCCLLLLLLLCLTMSAAQPASSSSPAPTPPEQRPSPGRQGSGGGGQVTAAAGQNTSVYRHITIKTHVVWAPPDPWTGADSSGDTEPSKLVILPLGAFLALIIATCIKASHWWNEDIREADGVLENIYTAKNPRRRVLARVLSVERDPRQGGAGGASVTGAFIQHTFYKKYRRKSKVVPEVKAGSPTSPDAAGYQEDVDSEGQSPDVPVVPMGAEGRLFQPQGAPECRGLERVPCRQESFASMGSGTELIPLLPMYSADQLKYQMNSPVLETTNVSFPPSRPPSNLRRPPPPPPQDSACPAVTKARPKHLCKRGSGRDRKPTRRKRVGGGGAGAQPHGVSKLVLDSFSFNLHLMQLALEEDLARGLQQQQQQGRGPGSSSSSPSHPASPPSGLHHLDHGFIEDSFIHPGEDHRSPRAPGELAEGSELNSPSTENTGLSSSAQSSLASAPWSPVRSRPLSRKDSASTLLTAALLESLSRKKASVSSFSSFGTSSTSLSQSTASQTGDSRLFYHLARTSPTSSPEGSGTETVSDSSSMKKSQTSADISQQAQDDRGLGSVGQAGPQEQWRPRFSSLRRKNSFADRPVFFIV